MRKMFNLRALILVSCALVGIAGSTFLYGASWINDSVHTSIVSAVQTTMSIAEVPFGGHKQVATVKQSETKIDENLFWVLRAHLDAQASMKNWFSEIELVGFKEEVKFHGLQIAMERRLLPVLVFNNETYEWSRAVVVSDEAYDLIAKSSNLGQDSDGKPFLMGNYIGYDLDDHEPNEKMFKAPTLANMVSH